MPSWTEVEALLAMERRDARRQREWERWLDGEAQVDLVATRCHQAYRMLGGELMSELAWRARARELMSGVT